MINHFLHPVLKVLFRWSFRIAVTFLMTVFAIILSIQNVIADRSSLIDGYLIGQSNADLSFYHPRKFSSARTYE